MAEGEAKKVKRNVLIPVDPSHHAEEGFTWFMDNVYHEGDHVVVLHVAELHPPALPHALATEEWKHEVEKHEQKVEELKKKYAQKCKDYKLDAKVKIVGVSTSVGAKVCEEAKIEEATLVVIGSRGMGLIRRTILGSVSDYVIHHAHCPVVVIPKTEAKKE
ncbi:uncharacterized protein LOC116287466 [Actinia tenebrosa]|uniref:Uncharacterized protein LOC116287466 n=1 Tax=Actinia tenebrosa TaxID=6105 RepID=A0A6P8H327_ACTTE|nr:uncharacterized protein LOC116287466 [Actinia tenebrosa]